MHPIFYGLAVILMAPCVGLVFIPMFPAIFMMLLTATGFGLIDGFTHLTGSNLGILAGIFILSVIIDQAAGMLGAKYGGASRKSILFGFIGLVLGTVLLPPFGGLIGLFVGVGGAELYAHNHRARAFRAAGASLLGAISGMFINAFLALVFLILFAVFAWS